MHMMPNFRKGVLSPLTKRLYQRPVYAFQAKIAFSLIVGFP